VASHLDFHEAVDGIKGDQQRELREVSLYINGALGSRAQEYDVVGAWADGAENSTMDVVSGSDWDKLTLAASMKGWLADQKQVLVFQESPGGQAAMAHFEATGDLTDIHKALLQDGVAFHTLVPHAGGATVYVADLDGSALDSIKKAAARYDAEVGIKFGRAEFLGTVKQDGTDREQRDDARAVYEGTIRQSQVAGHDQLWNRVRDRWGQGIHQAPVGAGTSASALFDQHNDPTATADAIIDSVPGAAVAVQTVERNLEGKPHTDAPASQGGFKQADGTYTPEREALHEHILDELFSPEAVKAATPASGERPVMTLLGGRGGSGKSWFTKQGIADAAHAIYINADDVQAKLPGYEGWNAALYHEEASDITKRADDRARALGLSVIHDATMRTPGGSAKRVAEYKAAGYAVHGHYMFLPPQTSTQRAIQRFMRGGTEGRYVPASYLLNSTTNERTFDSLKPSFDKWSVYENTGSAPRLVSAGEQQAKRNGRYSKRVVRTRSEPARRRVESVLAGKHGARAAGHRAAEATAAAEVARAFSPIIAYTQALFEGEQRFNPNHDPDTGEFASGDGGGSGGGSVAPTESIPAEKPTSGAGNGGGSTAKVKIDDFTKDKVDLGSFVADKSRADSFVKEWDEKIGEAPGQFKNDFLGGQDATMRIHVAPGGSWEIGGNVLGSGGRSVGSYNRIIDWRNKTAESAYFAMDRGATGNDIGKKVLAANIAMYQKAGIEKVKVHANIDVGGYAWAKYGYVPTRSSWNSLRADLQSKLDGDRKSGSGTGYTPESWDDISEDDQDAIKRHWMNDTRDEYLQSEIDNWRDNGDALDSAKSDVSSDFNDRHVVAWAQDALQEWFEEREEEGKPPVPYTHAQIVDAVTLDYASGYEGRGDLDITFDDDALREPSNAAPKEQMTLPGVKPEDYSKRLTPEMRDEIKKVLEDAFDKHADGVASDIEPPDYLSENIEEYQESSWDGMRDRDRYAYARDNDHLPTYHNDDDEDEQTELNIEGDAADGLGKLVRSPDPKAIWAIADSPQGKDLLLGSDWHGELNLKDPQTMERFNAYVGKAAKKAA
jgi:predicted ABC-type ATPase